MLSNEFILHKSIDIGLERLSSAIIFGSIIREYKRNDKGITELIDTLLMITDIDHITQMARDYEEHIHTK
jgi:hypothetical protein|tara:strand:+ start:380 stop:589 length:210 start_codon:yes stop_codon:yes gene_type:complete